MLTPAAINTLHLTPRQKRLAESYAALTFWEVHGVQRVHILDYLRYTGEGLDADAARSLEIVNDLGAILDRMDGTARD